MKNNKFSERQIEIIEAATKRIDEHGIQDLTIKTLAADLNLSEAALYRHFKSKNEILLGLLTYFIEEMKDRLDIILSNKDRSPSELLKDLFDSQFKTFVQKGKQQTTFMLANPQTVFIDTLFKTFLSNRFQFYNLILFLF